MRNNHECIIVVAKPISWILYLLRANIHGSKTAAISECRKAYVMYSITDSYGFSVFTVFKCSAPFDNKLSDISNIKEHSQKDFYKALLIEYTIPIYIKSTIPEKMIYGAARKGANVATRFMTRCTIAAITERTIIPKQLPPAHAVYPNRLQRDLLVSVSNMRI